MPNRVIRDWTDSETVDTLSFAAECLFTRLIMKADDFGSYPANPKLIRSSLFPLRTERVRDIDITKWLDECRSSGLIFLYTVSGKSYLRIVNFGQRLRNMRNKYPDPPNELENSANAATRSNSQQLADNSRPEGETKRNETNLESEGETKSNAAKSRPPSHSKKSSGHSFRESEYFDKEKFSADLGNSPPPYCNANPEYYYDALLNGSDSKGYKYLDWLATAKKWIQGDVREGRFQTKFSGPIKMEDKKNESSKFKSKQQQVTDHNSDQLRRVLNGDL